MSAGAPTVRWPISSSWICFAGFHVDRTMTSSSDMPIARNLPMTLSMSFIPAFMLLVWRSVEMESGTKPAFMSGTAVAHLKLVPPWPTSKKTPRARPSIIALLGPLSPDPARRGGRRTCACRCHPGGSTSSAGPWSDRFARTFPPKSTMTGTLAVRADFDAPSRTASTRGR